MFFLISLIFISKISLHFIPIVPYQFSNLVFQYGIHPYVNILLCTVVGSIIIGKRLLKITQPHFYQIKKYHFSIFVLCLFLFFITLLQILLVDSEMSWGLQLAASFSSVLTIIIFSRYIPTQLKPEIFLNWVFKYSAFFCWLSFVFLFLSSNTSFMGGRFIGIFKHIPHMVSVATMSFVFGLYRIFGVNQSLRQKLFSYSTLIISFVLLILTGTRSALISTLFCFVMSMILFKPSTIRRQLFQWLFFIIMLAGIGFFHQNIFSYSIDLIKGEQSIGYRAAQDGVASRWDEVIRGYDFLNRSPYLGHGLLSKFSEFSESVSGAYNAQKDPHNLFISAGVIGGFGFLCLIVLLYLGLCFLSLSRLKSENNAIKLMAIYMCSQLPILFIYHIHLSMGGIADRIYWLVIGYLAIDQINNNDKNFKGPL